MTPIAPHIATFLRERLPLERGASEHTCEAYAYTFKLLFEYAAARFKVSPSQLSLEQIDASLIMDFLAALEFERGNKCILAKHAKTAATHYPSLTTKRISPHVLRHNCALMILQATGDLRKVALWLGHTDMQTTEIYLRIDPSEKLDALDTVAPLNLKPGCFRTPDALIALLRST